MTLPGQSQLSLSEAVLREDNSSSRLSDSYLILTQAAKRILQFGEILQIRIFKNNEDDVDSRYI